MAATATATDAETRPPPPSLGSAAIERAQSTLTATQTHHDALTDGQEQEQEQEQRHDSKEPPRLTARWKLRIEAACWRVLMEIGMVLHRIAPPTPPYPSTRVRIPSTISQHAGHIGLCIYQPPPPPAARSRSRSRSHPDDDDDDDDLLPCVLAFHGGGFTIGKATDDARWAGAIIEQVPAVVVAVDYRLAPAHPFPTAVQDGVDALLYIHAHAQQLHIDVARIALSGFSAGGNLVFTVPLLLNELQRSQQAALNDGRVRTPAIHNHQGTTTTLALPTETLNPLQPPPDHINPAAAAASLPPIPPALRPAALIAWYPSLDFSQSRADRRATNTRQELEMPLFFHNLFDASYLFPLNDLDVCSPFLSPARASDGALLDALPEHIAIYAAEWDGLSQEAMRFARRLQALGKHKVSARVLEGTTHGWDRSPNPLYAHKLLDAGYRDACKVLRDVFSLPTPEAVLQREQQMQQQSAKKEQRRADDESRSGSSSSSTTTTTTTTSSPIAVHEGAALVAHAKSPLSYKTADKVLPQQTRGGNSSNKRTTDAQDERNEPPGTEAERQTMATSARKLADGLGDGDGEGEGEGEGEGSTAGGSAALTPTSPFAEQQRELRAKQREGIAGAELALQGLPGPPSSASDEAEGGEQPLSPPAPSSADARRGGPPLTTLPAAETDDQRSGSSSSNSNILSKARRVLSRSSDHDAPAAADDDDSSSRSASRSPSSSSSKSLLTPVAKALSAPALRMRSSGAGAGDRDAGEEEDAEWDEAVHGAEEGTVVRPGKVVATKAERGEAMVLELVDEEGESEGEGESEKAVEAKAELVGEEMGRKVQS